MNPQCFDVRIITPERIFLETKAVSLVAPGEVGYLGILRNHAPLMTPLVKGTLTLRDESGRTQGYDIPEGFLEVSKNRVLILVPEVAQ